jgi:hypothetical protein
MVRPFGRSLFLAILLTLLLSISASADPGEPKSQLGVLDLLTASLIGVDDDAFALADPLTSDPGTQHFGPYASLSSDSGTCGNEWATDEMNRFFQIQQTGLNSYRVIEKFRDGTFTVPSLLDPTSPQLSPGACESSDGSGPGLVNEGVTGTFHGYDIITITGATAYSPSTAGCLGTCFSTDDFLITVFPAGYVRDDTAYFFHYVASDQNTLTYHEWKNASCNRGGNHGDIQSIGASAPFTTALCTGL